MITNHGEFCYWDSKSFEDTIVLIWNLCIAFILFFYCLRIYFRARKMLIKQGLLKLFALLFAWSITYGVGVIFSVMLYFFKFSDSNKYEKSEITIYSRVYQFIETIPAIIIQSLLFYVPLKMIYNIMSLYQLNNCVPKPTEIRAYERLKNYGKIRALFLIGWLLIIFPFSPQVEQILTIIKTGLLLIDCSICMVALNYTRSLCLQKSQTLLVNNIKAQERLKQQTTALTFCCIGRFVMDCTFYIIFPILKPSPSEMCIDEINKHWEFTIGYLFFGSIVMHFITVFVIIRMYKLDPDQQNENGFYSSMIEPKNRQSIIFDEQKM